MKIGKIFNIEIRLHSSWWFIFFLIAWSLSSSFFPAIAAGLSTGMYWMMGLVSALLLFVSVLLHELSHSLVAKAKNIEVESITLFFFGGVAGITDEEMDPKSEFMMAIAGPVFSLVLAGIFFLAHSFTSHVIVNAMTLYLYQLNFILALFNLVPAFPLDGGRAFRAILHAYFKDIQKATRIASTGGRIFGGFLFFLGIYGLFTGAPGGLWFLLLGGFLYFIARISNDQVVMKTVLVTIPIKDVMKPAKVVPSGMKISQFGKKYVHSDKDVFLVTGTPLRILDLNKIGAVPQTMTVKQVSFPVPIVLSEKGTAYTAFSQFARHGVDLLPVMRGKKVVGAVSKNDVMHRVSWLLHFGGAKLGKRFKK